MGTSTLLDAWGSGPHEPGGRKGSELRTSWTGGRTGDAARTRKERAESRICDKPGEMLTPRNVGPRSAGGLLSSRAWWWVIALAFALLVGVARPAQAGVAVEMGLSHLVKVASAVVVATPVESRSEWVEEDGRQRIVTWHRLQTERVVAGALPTTGETWVRTLGGRVGDIGQKVEGEAVLPQGKRMVLFLLARPDGGAVVAGMAQGAWMVVRGADGAERLEPQKNRGVLVPNKARESAQAVLTGRVLDEVLRVIEAAHQARGR